MKSIGIILAGGNNNRIGRLSDKRAIAALPVAGSYRAIDFTLSNMSNSRVSKVAVLPQFNARSLNEHLSSSKWWDFGRKQGGLYVFTPTVTKNNNSWYQGTADALYQNIDFLKKSHEPYVIIATGDGVYKMDYGKVLEAHIAKNADITVVYTTLKDTDDDLTRFGVLKLDENERIVEFEEKPLVASSNNVSIGVYNIDFLKKSHEPYVIIATGDGVYKMDYGKVLEAHIAKNADITVVYTTLKDTDDDLTRFGVLKLDENERITEFEEKPLVASSNNVSIGVYVIRRRHLIEILERCAREDRHDFVQDVLVRYRNVRKIYGYKLDTYWRNIATVDSYYKTNMDFLKKDVRDYFFKQYPDVYSKVDDLPPAKYNTGAEVKNSIISSGCIVNGKVENSIIFKDVYIGNNCTIKNSIILNDVYIGDDSYIENCIVESRDTLRPGTNYVGTDDEVKIVIEKNVRYIL